MDPPSADSVPGTISLGYEQRVADVVMPPNVQSSRFSGGMEVEMIGIVDQ